MRDLDRQKQSRTVIIAVIGMAVGLSVVDLLSDRQLMSSVTLAADRSHREESLVSDSVEDFKQGQVYLNQKKYEQSIEAFNKAESKGLTLYELFVFRGTAYHELRQFQNAKRDAEKAIELQPTRMLGYELLAGVHMRWVMLMRQSTWPRTDLPRWKASRRRSSRESAASCC